jgi:peptidoglycan hydrolase-like protein with peptidoglycan-binding domain
MMSHRVTRAIASTAAAIALLLEGPFGLASSPALVRAAERGNELVARRRHAPGPSRRFVSEAQRTLQRLGYEPGPIDGVVGPRTRSALLSFQETKGLAATGQLDPESMARLDIYERLFQQLE